MGLDERAVATDRHRIGDGEEQVGIEALRVAGIRTSSDEQLPRRRDPDRRKRPVVVCEEHHEVEEIPESVVHRRRCKEHDVLALAAEQALHSRVPRRVLVSQRVRLVDDNKAVRVLVRHEMTPREWTRRELLVLRKLVEGQDLGRKPFDGVVAEKLGISGIARQSRA